MYVTGGPFQVEDLTGVHGDVVVVLTGGTSDERCEDICKKD